MPKMIDIQLETGEIKSVEVSPENTVGGLMESLGYQGMTLTRGDHKLALDDTFTASGGDLLPPDEAAEYQPYGIGLAE